jgi:hypothetical protein
MTLSRKEEIAAELRELVERLEFDKPHRPLTAEERTKWISTCKRAAIILEEGL